jgi:uncharacterized protein YpmB
MKFFILLSLLTLSVSVLASEDKCYSFAKKAAFQEVKNDEEVVTMSDFENFYGDESVEVLLQNGWQKEYWSFSNGSSIVNVEIDAVKTRCFVKKVDFSQNDQDWE